MTQHITPLVVAFKTVTLVLGGTITYLAFSAARRTGVAGLRWLAIGFAIVTLGALLGGIVDLFLTVAPSTALAVESGLTAAGFLVVVYSLYATRSGRRG